MKTTAEIIETIRALLRLAKSDNPHEAANALAKASAIAARHHLDLDDISPDDDLRRIVGDELDLPYRLADEYKEALNTVYAFFNVHVTLLCGVSTKSAMIVGSRLDIELASYVVTFLVRSCRDCLSKWREAERKLRRKTTGTKVKSYVQGFFRGVRSRLHAEREQQKAEHSGLALILSNGEAARKDVAHGLLHGLKPNGAVVVAKARLNHRAAFQGFVAGRDTQIRPGLKAEPVLTLEG